MLSKSYDHTLYNTLAGTSNAMTIINHAFSVEQLSTLKATISNLIGPYDKQNLTLVVI